MRLVRSSVSTTFPDPASYPSIPVYDLLTAAARGYVAVDLRLIRAITDRGNDAIPDLLKFGLEDHSDDLVDLEEDLIAIFRELGTPQALPYLLNLIRNDPGAAEAEMTQLREQLRSVITDIRRVVYNLRPPALDELGMLSAIREHAMQFASQGLRVEFDVPQHLPALPAAVELAAYRIIIEAITNVARHAEAENCRVRLSIADNVYIEVMDDGVGLGPDQRAGVGISSMRERAGELGGDVIFESPPGGGTRVLAQLPLGLARDLDSLKTRPGP